MQNDSLFRISLKCIIKNAEGDVLVVKERGRNSWDLPGGGIDHNENIHAAIARELKEEAGYEGSFTHEVYAIEDPFRLLTRDIWQMRIILNVFPKDMEFATGSEADDIQFISPLQLKDSEYEAERQVYKYLKNDK